MVSLSQPSLLTGEVDFTTQDGSALSGLDYLGMTGTLIFAPGETGKTIAVPTFVDNLYEPTEYFTVELSNPTNLDITQ